MHKRVVWKLALAVGAVGIPLGSDFGELSRAAHGITVRHDQLDSDYRTLGNNLKYRSVGSMTWVSGPFQEFCSAVLITPKWVLSAGHCTEPGGVRQFNVGGTSAFNGTNYSEADHFHHPSWTGDLSAGFDIGLVRLSSAVTGIVPASRFVGEELGMTGTSVGFGLTGTGTNGATLDDALKRGATNVIDVYDTFFGRAGRVMLSDFDDPGNVDGRNAWGSSMPTELEGSIAGGDSGGGTFVDVGTRTYLAGVHSFGSAFAPPNGDGQPNGSYSDLFGSSRVNSHNMWIDDNIAHVWKNAASGTFGSSTNWSLGPGMLAQTPVFGDIVSFKQAGNYTVTLSGNTSNWQLLSRRGGVTVNLNGFTWSLTANNHDGGVVVGKYQFEPALLALNNGTLNSVDTHIALGPGSVGTVNLGSGIVWNNIGDLNVGGNYSTAGGSASLVLTNAATPPRLNIGGTLRIHQNRLVSYGAGTLTAGATDIRGGFLLLGTGRNKAYRTGSSITMTGGAIDLTDNSMIVDYSGTSPIDSVAALIAAGYNNGAWTGTGGIRSGAAQAAASTSTKTALGYAEAADLGVSTFAGYTVDSTTVLITYALVGDANLDGTTNLGDFNRLAANFNQSGHWFDGDFNFDFMVNLSDFNLLAANFNKTLPAGFGSEALGAAVPEPASIAALLTALPLLARRVRRKV